MAEGIRALFQELGAQFESLLMFTANECLVLYAFSHFITLQNSQPTLATISNTINS